MLYILTIYLVMLQFNDISIQGMEFSNDLLSRSVIIIWNNVLYASCVSSDCSQCSPFSSMFYAFPLSFRISYFFLHFHIRTFVIWWSRTPQYSAIPRYLLSEEVIVAFGGWRITDK